MYIDFLLVLRWLRARESDNLNFHHKLHMWQWTRAKNLCAWLLGIWHFFQLKIFSAVIKQLLGACLYIWWSLINAIYGSTYIWLNKQACEEMYVRSAPDERAKEKYLLRYPLSITDSTYFPNFGDIIIRRRWEGELQESSRLPVLGVFFDVVLVSAAGGGVLLGCISSSSLSDSLDDLNKSRRKDLYSLVVSFFSLPTLFWIFLREEELGQP